MFLYGNLETRSCNHCWSGKAISIMYSQCVFVALGIQHEMRMRHVFIWPVPQYFIFPHLMNGMLSGKKEKVTEHKKCVWIFPTTFVWNISRSKKNSTNFGLHVKCRHSFDIVMKLEFTRQIFEKYWSEILWYSVQWEQSCTVRTDGRTDGHDEAVVINVLY